MTASLSIGVIAYAATPGLVFVRVPNERGRWIMVDRSVVEVDCPTCKAVTGEPCRADYRRHGMLGTSPRYEPIPAEQIKYHVAVHVSRKQQCQTATGHRRYATRLPPYKLRIKAEDLAAAQSNAPTQEGE